MLARWIEQSSSYLGNFTLEGLRIVLARTMCPVERTRKQIRSGVPPRTTCTSHVPPIHSFVLSSGTVVEYSPRWPIRPLILCARNIWRSRSRMASGEIEFSELLGSFRTWEWDEKRWGKERRGGVFLFPFFWLLSLMIF